MRSRKRNAFRTLLVVLMLVMLFPGVTAQAASKKKALKAYKKLLSKNTIMIAPKNARIWPEINYKGTKKKNARFSLAYLDADKVSELFVYDPSAGYAVFRYKKKEKRYVPVMNCIGLFQKGIITKLASTGPVVM